MSTPFSTSMSPVTPDLFALSRGLDELSAITHFLSSLTVTPRGVSPKGAIWLGCL